jgi:micrococcal nuclease
VTLALLSVLTIGACTSPNATPRATTPRTSGAITRVVDGDTIVVDTSDGSLSVRLVEINAPEADECYADQAREYLARDEGAVVTLEVVGVDQFERKLAHVFVGSRHLNLEIVEDGMAIAGTPDGDDIYGEAILAAEQDAYEQRLGLWGPGACGASGQPPTVAIDADRSTPDPIGPDDENLEAEMITLADLGTAPVDISGWVLRDESSRNRYKFADDVVLTPGARISITSADPGWTPGGGPVWNNHGDTALLQDDLGTVVDRWRY